MLPKIGHRHRMIDHQIHRHMRIDLLGIAAERLHGVAHGGKVDHRRHAGEVLHQHARRAEGELVVGRFGLEPLGHRLDVVLGHRAPVFIAQQVFQQDLHRERQAGDAFETVAFGGRQAEIGVALATGFQGFAASKAIKRSHVECFHSRPGSSAGAPLSHWQAKLFLAGKTCDQIPFKERRKSRLIRAFRDRRHIYQDGSIKCAQDCDLPAARQLPRGTGLGYGRPDAAHR